MSLESFSFALCLLLCIASWSRKLSHVTGCVAVLYIGKLKKVKSKIKRKLKGKVHCFEFALPVNGLLCLVRGRGQLTHVTVCLVLFRWFVWFWSCEGKTVICYFLFGLIRFALICSALLCIGLLICGMTKNEHML